MYTSARVKEDIYEVDRTCMGLDKWIEQELVPHFKECAFFKNFIIGVWELEDNGWSPYNFQYEMERRGFVIYVDATEYYYEVSLP